MPVAHGTLVGVTYRMPSEMEMSMLSMTRVPQLASSSYMHTHALRSRQTNHVTAALTCLRQSKY